MWLHMTVFSIRAGWLARGAVGQFWYLSYPATKMHQYPILTRQKRARCDQRTHDGGQAARLLRPPTGRGAQGEPLDSAGSIAEHTAASTP